MSLLNSEAEKKRGEFSSSTFCSSQALSELSDAHPHWGKPTTLLNVPIQMLISSRNTLLDTLRNNI